MGELLYYERNIGNKKMKKEINLTKLALEIVGYNPFVLPRNKCNIGNEFVFKVRALFKLMVYTHWVIIFPRHFDPDLGQYRMASGELEYLPLEDTIEGILKYRTGNCGTYSLLFRKLAEALGFKARLIILKSKDKTQGHYTAEVLVDNKWIFFDPMYINCPFSSTKEFYSAYDIVENPLLYINNLMFKGITKNTWLKIWEGIQINKINSFDISKKEFMKKFYGKNNEK